MSAFSEATHKAVMKALDEVKKRKILDVMVKEQVFTTGFMAGVRWANNHNDEEEATKAGLKALVDVSEMSKEQIFTLAFLSGTLWAWAQVNKLSDEARKAYEKVFSNE